MRSKLSVLSSQALGGGNYLRFRIVTEKPREVADFTVQYEAVIDGKTYPVVRYDALMGSLIATRWTMRGTTSTSRLAAQ